MINLTDSFKVFQKIGLKAGQMVLLGFRGCEIRNNSHIARDLSELNLGGVILFDEEMVDSSLRERNIRSINQVKTLTKAVQRYARTPAWIAIDQEGGRVNRLKPIYGFPESISQEELGAKNNLAETYSHAKKMAETLAGVGINFNLAPVVDLAANAGNPVIQGKGRSFSADPDIVAKHAMEFVLAHRKHGIATCLKHFPGHGSASGDTHLGLVDVTKEWTERELVPFQQLIDSKLCDAVMTAHVFNSNLDAENPATLSKAVVDEILRRRLGFDGVVISDDLEMKAISSQYGLRRAIELGLAAGVDVFCLGNNMTHDPDIAAKAISIILKLAMSDTIYETRVLESLQRIEKMKRRFKLI